MSTEISSDGSSALDTLKLVVALVFLVAGVYGFYYFEAEAAWIRLLGLLGVVAVAVFIVLQTPMGRGIWRFAADSRTEVRKVVWPTRQETLQTLLIIVIAVLITALFLWAVDSILFWVVRLATGQA